VSKVIDITPDGKQKSTRGKKKSTSKVASEPREQYYEEPGEINPEPDDLDRRLFKDNPILNETELGNSLRFSWVYSTLMFFNHALKSWFIWSQTHWAVDTSNKVLRCLTHVLIKDATFRKSVGGDWYQMSFMNSKLRAALKIAADLLPLPSPLDSHPYLLNLKNGTIDLKTGELQEHDPADYITKLAPVEYKPDASCPKWKDFLNRAFEDFPAGITYLQKILGYAMTSDVSEKCFFIFYGPDGSNGKSMLINVVRAILGADYRIQIAAESLTVNRVSAIRSDIARLMGFRFGTTSETNEAIRFNEAMIKSLTGSDPMTARKLYQNDIEFTPELKLFIATNARPHFNLSDPAMMSRVVIIPFNVAIPVEEQNRNLTAELIAEESEGILAWLVQGAVLWAQERLGPNPFDTKDVAIVISLNKFVETCCVRGKGLKVTSTRLLDVFNLYKTEMGDDAPDLKIKEFGQMLTDAGIPSKRERDGVYRLNLDLNEYGKRLLNVDTELTSEPDSSISMNDVNDVNDVNDESGKDDE